MGKAQARVATAATLAAAYAAWHLTGGMHGAVFRLHTPPAVTAVTTAAISSQCQDLPAAPTSSPTAMPAPSPTAASTSPAGGESGAQLCVSVQAAQASIKRGKTATWTIQVWAHDGPAASVTITLTASQAGITPEFTGACPSGAGTATCVIGDMDTTLTPSSYQLQAQTSVPATVTASSLTLTAAAETSPAITAVPAAGQTITITAPAPTPAPARTKAVPHPSPPQPVPVPASVPVTTLATEPAIGALPTMGPVATTVPPGSVSTVLPEITPAVATAPAVSGITVMSSPAANIQAVPTGISTPGADSFSVSIGMSAQTAQILGIVFLALVIILAATKLTSTWLTRTKKTAVTTKQPPDGNRNRLRLRRLRLRLSTFRFPRLRARGTRTERRAIREQNWKRHLETQQEAPPPGSQSAGLKEEG
jgi:hypothetical protein